MRRFYPSDFPHGFSASSPAFRVAECRAELHAYLNDVLPNADALTRAIDALIDAKLAEQTRAP